MSGHEALEILEEPTLLPSFPAAARLPLLLNGKKKVSLWLFLFSYSFTVPSTGICLLLGLVSHRHHIAR